MTNIPKLHNWRNQPNIDNMNEVIEVIQGIVDQGIEGPPGDDGADGTDGDDGWAPVLGIESDSGGRYLFVADWTGGTGTKPATGDYIGSTGLVASIDDAINIRGAAGTDGTDGTDGEGVPIGGADGNILAKASASDYDTTWIENSLVNLSDTPSSLGSSQQHLGIQLDAFANPEIVWLDPPSDTSTLVGLSDTPSSFGSEGQVLAVNANLNGVEWVDVSGGVSQFTGLSDTPAGYGTDGQVLTSTGSGMAWEDAGGGGGGVSITFGTFTPTIPAFTGTYYMQNGVYWDLGDVVWISAEFDCDNPTDSSLYIEGLPFSMKYPQDVDPAFILACPLNASLPTNSKYAVGNAYNDRIYINDENGTGQTTGTTRFGLLISGWYRKA